MTNMNLEHLKSKFIVDDAIRTRLEPIISKALSHCVIDKKGHVHITSQGLSSKNQVMLTLAARAIASQLDSTISANVTIRDISISTSLPENQVRARAKDLIEAKFAEAFGQGLYKANFHRVETFLDSIGGACPATDASKIEAHRDTQF